MTKGEEFQSGEGADAKNGSREAETAGHGDAGEDNDPEETDKGSNQGQKPSERSDFYRRGGCGTKQAGANRQRTGVASGKGGVNFG